MIISMQHKDKMNNYLHKTIKKICTTVILFSMLLISGCGKEQAVHSFNEETETSVDNISENTEAVDKNLINTEEPSDVNENPTVTLVMVGDILLHISVEQSCHAQDGSYQFSGLFANVKERVQAADIALVNQEVILGGEELGVSGYPAFNAPYEVADALVDTGFNVILHATNHAMDKGKTGIVNCISNWEEKYPEIEVLGINKSKETQDTITILQENGIKIAVLNYTYGLNGISLPADMPYAVNLLEEDKVKTDIALAKQQSDFVVVCPHWGTEYSLQPDSMQEKWTKIFAENGVDLVIGTHPHVIEPIEWVEDETTGNRMLVYYSLGNFVNWTSGSGKGIANRMVGGMADVTIGLDENGEAVIEDYGVRALVTQVESGYGGVTTYFLKDYTDELAEKNAIVKQDADFSKEYCEKLCDEVWGDLWE